MTPEVETDLLSRSVSMGEVLIYDVTVLEKQVRIWQGEESVRWEKITHNYVTQEIIKMELLNPEKYILVGIELCKWSQEELSNAVSNATPKSKEC